jgi:tetratricopeptide (TPR) repeat protein
MHPDRIPALSALAPGAHAVVLEAASGAARRTRLTEWVREASATSATHAWLLQCDVKRGGLWAGVGDWLAALLPGLEAEAADLVVRYDHELTQVVPDLRRRLRPRYVTLTDSSSREEAVRNYAADRAHRIGHGVIDLLAEWHRRSGGGRWVIACDGFDRSGVMVAELFRHLLRRRGAALDLVLLAAVELGQGSRVAADLEPHARVRLVHEDLEPGGDEAPEPHEAARLAAEMEAWVRQDTLHVRAHGHEVIRLWEAAGRPDRAAEWHALVMGLLTQMGFYADAVRHARVVRENLTLFDVPGALYPRFALVNKLQVISITLGRPEEAREILEHEGLDHVADPEHRAMLLYQLAMLHARFLPRRDQAEAERRLNEALAELERAEMAPEEHAFMLGFLLNGLAYVRFRQGDAPRAVELSHENFDRLEKELPTGRHRLHRSVLLYNAGQVFSQAGELDEAVRHLSAAMELDPHYSEYYNDRGNLYLRQGRLPEAEQDYLRAIELSPPYPEVWTNLGQCLLRQGRTAEAEDAYERAVDLDPARPQAWTNLGRLRHARGARVQALEAYDGAVAADPENALVLANRAAVHFELGQADPALADLERAVSLAPENAALRQNRTRLLAALARDAGEAALSA